MGGSFGSGSRRSTLTISDFKGVDLTNQPAGVEKGRACYSVNMIRDVPGKVRKRMGYFLLESYPDRINGIWSYRGQLVVHSGSCIYYGGELLWEEALDQRSYGLALGDSFYILDGGSLLRLRAGGETPSVAPAAQDARVPTVTIGRGPSGGGQAFQPVNLLTGRRADSFLGTAGDRVYQLSFGDLSDSAVSARLRNASGWQELTENQDFTVDRAAGTLTFSTAPGESPVTGEDNLVVEYECSEDQSSLIGRCRFGIKYGLAGAADRLFISGDPQNPGRDYYCASLDGSYWGDLWYSSLGSEDTPITGYSVVEGALATHLRGGEQSRNVILREGVQEDGETAFLVRGIIQGEGAVNPWAFGYIREPLFLSSEGICATTPYEYTGERYIQPRSFYIWGELRQEPGLEEATAAVWGDFFLLAVNGRVYALDTLRRAGSDGVRSDYQYEGYLLDNIPARVLASDGERLLFGTAEGKVMQFYNQPEALESYSDCGEAISARWDMDFSGDEFFRAKTLRSLSARLAAYPNTSVEVWRRERGVWEPAFSELSAARYLSFGNVCFSKWTFSCDENPRTIIKRFYSRKLDAVRISLQNNQLNEPFGLFELALESSSGGKYRP